MSIIQSNKSPRASTFTGFGTVSSSDDSWLNALPVDVVRADGKKCGRTVDGIWVSAGASYGAQVEFPSAAAAKAFMAANEGTRPAVGTTHPRVVTDTVALFVAAYCAAAGKTAPATVKAEETVPTQTVPAAVAAPAIDAELFAQFLAFQAFMKSQGK